MKTTPLAGAGRWRAIASPATATSPPAWSASPPPDSGAPGTGRRRAPKGGGAAGEPVRAVVRAPPPPCRLRRGAGRGGGRLEGGRGLQRPVGGALGAGDDAEPPEQLAARRAERVAGAGRDE